MFYHCHHGSFNRDNKNCSDDTEWPWKEIWEKTWMRLNGLHTNFMYIQILQHTKSTRMPVASMLWWLLWPTQQGGQRWKYKVKICWNCTHTEYCSTYKVVFKCSLLSRQFWKQWDSSLIHHKISPCWLYSVVLL